MSYIDDEHTVFDFGKYIGKRIIDVPSSYLDWILKYASNKPIADAIIRIRHRKGVTNLIKSVNSENIGMPGIFEVTASTPRLERPAGISPSLYGSFIEYLIKSHLGLSIDDEVIKVIETHTVDQRIAWIKNSFDKQKRSITDICNLSFAHSIMMESLNEKEAAKLYKYVQANTEYFENYLQTLHLPIPDPDEQYTCNVSVGCVIGVIDMISNEAIVDIKCCVYDDVEAYKKQLFTYACLHYLRFGNKITRCEIYNFLTGKQFIMPLGDSCVRLAKGYISLLGRECPFHVKLFN